MKKFVALALTVVMVIGLLAGCQKPMDAQTLAQKMDEAMKAQTSMSGKMTMEMDMTMAMTGMSFEMGIGADMDVKANMETRDLYMAADITMEILGQNETMSMEVYMAPGDEGIVSYMYDSTTDSWTKSVEEPVEIEGELSAMELSTLPVENLVLAEEKVLLNEKEYYHLTVTMPGDQFQSYMDEMMAAMGSEMEEMDEESQALLDSIDWSLLTANAVYYVDPETCLPVQSEIELSGMGDLMNGMLSGVLAEALLGTGMEEMELTIDIPTCKGSMTELVYGDVEIPTVPQEGIDAAALNPLQADGSYVLRSGDEAMRIVVPEGYEGMTIDTLSMAVFNEDYTVSAMYGYETAFTAQDMLDSCEAEVAYYQEDEGTYVSHAYGEFNGFTTMILRLNDGSATYYAWQEAAEGVFYVMVNAYGPIDTPDVFLECVNPYEG